MFSVPLSLPTRSAEKLQVKFEGMSIPISVKELTAWVDDMSKLNSGKTGKKFSNPEIDERAISSDLSSWLNLLDMEGRSGLLKVLKAPLIKDQSMARQMITSWAGIQLLDKVSNLVRLDNDRSGAKVINTLEVLLQEQKQVNTLDLLKALPAESIFLDLDALLKIANLWRTELENQKRLVNELKRIPKSSNENVRKPDLIRYQDKESSSFLYELNVEHRLNPLSLEVWSGRQDSVLKESWIVFMPGLGSTQAHFRWLARLLSNQGWPVVLLEHPGSDAQAVKGLLDGSSPAPGAEVLPDRLSDLYSVLLAKEQGNLNIGGEKVVLMGHSLGALTAFLGSGALPQMDLEIRCENALDDLSLTNLSKLLQCQMVDLPSLMPKKIPKLNAIVALNSFGSLLWPSPNSVDISVPFFLAGGTYDLITPAIPEQLKLFLSTQRNPFSRVLLIEGASHFSPIRVDGQLNQNSGNDLFQLGEALVGFQPLQVQDILGIQIIEFLESIEIRKNREFSRSKRIGRLNYHLLDRSLVKKLLGL